MVNELLEIGGKIIDRVVPDQAERDRQKMELRRMEQDGALKDLEVRMSAIVMEAQSKDPWTSRARPSFLYVMYAMILAAVPMGICSAISPSTATAIAAGMQAWLSSIPTEMWTLFGVGYLGYTGARTWDKRSQAKK